MRYMIDTRRILRAIGSFFAALLVGAAAFAVGYLIGRAHKQEPEIVYVEQDPIVIELPGEVEKRVVTLEEVEAKLSEIGELATHQGVYAVRKSADFSRYWLDDIPIAGTTNIVDIACEGVVKVGFDVFKMGVEIDEVSSTIYVKLPEAEVLDNYIIWDTVTCNEKNNLLNPIDFAQYQTMIGELEALGLEQVQKDGIMDAAEKSVKHVIEHFLAAFVDYRVKFL